MAESRRPYPRWSNDLETWFEEDYFDESELPEPTPPAESAQQKLGRLMAEDLDPTGSNRRYQAQEAADRRLKG